MAGFGESAGGHKPVTPTAAVPRRFRGRGGCGRRTWSLPVWERTSAAVRCERGDIATRRRFQLSPQEGSQSPNRGEAVRRGVCRPPVPEPSGRRRASTCARTVGVGRQRSSAGATLEAIPARTGCFCASTEPSPIGNAAAASGGNGGWGAPRRAWVGHRHSSRGARASPRCARALGLVRDPGL
jgi:hypothetical protein